MSAARLLWREFCDFSAATPAVPRTPRLLLSALVAVLFLRALLAIAILTPAGLLAVTAMLGWDLPEMAP